MAFGPEAALYLRGYFEEHGPGAALGIARHGERGHRECIGCADIAAELPITPRTAFDLASVSKVFTATAVLLLEERGRLRLDDPIGLHLAGLPGAGECRPVTVRDLLWHTSSLPDYIIAGLAGAFEFLADAVLRWTAEVVRRATPGRKHEYSNTNYFLLAEIVSAAAGMPFADYVHANLFEPFGLADTFMLGRCGDTVVRARGYQNVGIGLPRHQRSELDLPTLGDGGVFSSLDDLLRWQDLFFGGHILQPVTLKRVLTPGRLDDGTPFEYGCGAMIETLAPGRTWCGHTGAWSGAAVLLGRLVEEQVSLVVLSNEQHAPVVHIAQRSLAAWQEMRIG